MILSSVWFWYPVILTSVFPLYCKVVPISMDFFLLIFSLLFLGLMGAIRTFQPSFWGPMLASFPWTTTTITTLTMREEEKKKEDLTPTRALQTIITMAQEQTFHLLFSCLLSHLQFHVFLVGETRQTPPPFQKNQSLAKQREWDKDQSFINRVKGQTYWRHSQSYFFCQW